MSLKSKEQKIYEILKNRELYRNEKGIFTMCPQKLLIRLSGKGERTVQYALKNLEKQGYTHREWLADEHIMLYYFPKEDFADRHIHNRYKNAPHSTDCIEKIAPIPQSVTENCTHSTYDLEKNCTHSTDCIEKIAPPPQSVVENVHSTNCVVITKSQKKPLLPHMELSAIQAERMFYVLPTGPVSNFLFDILNSGKDIAELPARKKQVNHSTHYEVKQNKEKRLVTMDNDSCTVSVEIKNIDELSKTGMRFFVLAMIKANEQIIHDGKLSREYITFSLQELVDIGMYACERSAREGFCTAISALTSLKVMGKITKGKRKTLIEDLSVLFVKGSVKKNECHLYMNPYINWNFLVQYFTQIPRYFFRLSDNTAKLLYYICYLARQNTQSIAEKGYFTIKFRAIQNLMNLPSEQGNPKPQETIKLPIEKAIKEIETEQSKSSEKQEFSMIPIYNEKMKMSEYLDEGYLLITMKGQFSKNLIDLQNQKLLKLLQSEKRQERITEKAISINIAKSMKN